jgi:hypothetical protein
MVIALLDFLITVFASLHLLNKKVLCTFGTMADSRQTGTSDG